MNDRVFVDTNVLIYAYSEEKVKREKAIRLIKENDTIISIQVINEFVNVAKKKFSKNHDEILESLGEIEASFEVWEKLNIELTRKALNLSNIYKYSYYDSLIIAAALGANCSILYSEDMHHNQLIEKQLKIINPFFPNSPD